MPVLRLILALGLAFCSCTTAWASAVVAKSGDHSCCAPLAAQNDNVPAAPAASSCCCVPSIVSGSVDLAVPACAVSALPETTASLETVCAVGCEADASPPDPLSRRPAASRAPPVLTA